jgi:hypothetical protein
LTLYLRTSSLGRGRNPALREIGRLREILREGRRRQGQQRHSPQDAAASTMRARKTGRRRVALRAASVESRNRMCLRFSNRCRSKGHLQNGDSTVASSFEGQPGGLHPHFSSTRHGGGLAADGFLQALIVGAFKQRTDLITVEPETGASGHRLQQAPRKRPLERLANANDG